MMKPAFFLCAIFCLLYACEGIVHGSGYVFDEITRQPLDGVQIENSRNEETSLTDSTGHFNAEVFVGCGCNPDCGGIIISLSKEGYQTLEIKNPMGDTLFLKPK